jgi:serine/threonine protein kinase
MDVGSFRRSSPSKTLRVEQVRLIMAQIVDATAALHSMNIIHTGKSSHEYLTQALTSTIDIKPNNVLFRDGTSSEEIQEILNNSSPATSGEFVLHGKRYPIMLSQPIVHPHKWDDSAFDVELYSICLMDFGHGRFPAIPTYLLSRLILQRNWAIEIHRRESSARTHYDHRKSYWVPALMPKLTSGPLAAW